MAPTLYIVMYIIHKKMTATFLLWLKSDIDIHYNNASDKAAKKLLTRDMGHPLGGPRRSEIISVTTDAILAAAHNHPEKIGSHGQSR